MEMKETFAVLKSAGGCKAFVEAQLVKSIGNTIRHGMLTVSVTFAIFRLTKELALIQNHTVREKQLDALKGQLKAKLGDIPLPSSIVDLMNNIASKDPHYIIISYKVGYDFEWIAHLLDRYLLDLCFRMHLLNRIC